MRAPSPASSAPPDLSGDRAVTEWLEAQPGHLTFAKLLAAHVARFGTAGALSPQALWRAWLIQPVIRDTDPGSRERGAAIAEIARQILPDWMGRARQVAEKTVRSWVSEYATGGPAALARKPPSNRAQPRVHVSRAWDQAMRTAGIAEGTLAGIARALRDKVRLLWSDGRPNRTVVLQGATPFLMEQTRLAGLILPAEPHLSCTCCCMQLPASRLFPTRRLPHQPQRNYSSRQRWDMDCAGLDECCAAETDPAF